MDNPVKENLLKVRDKFLNKLSSRITELESSVNTKLDEVLAVVKTVQSTQEDVKHDQKDIYFDIRDKLQNTGTLVLSDKEMITKIFSGTKMFLDPRDLVVATHIALDHIWEYPITMAWLNVVGKNDTVIDIGANFGYYGLIATQRMEKKDSKVIFFEANPHLIPYIRKTLTMDWLHEQCDIENLGVADKKGTATLTVLKDYIGSASLHTNEHMGTFLDKKMIIETEQEIKVPTVRLDDYCKQKGIANVDLIKMDIEGYEERAYRGMRKIIHASPNVTMFVEFTKESYDKPEEFYSQMLSDFGHVYKINDDGKLTKYKNPTYEKVIGNPADWVMPVFSKRADLAT